LYAWRSIAAVAPTLRHKFSIPARRIQATSARLDRIRRYADLGFCSDGYCIVAEDEGNGGDNGSDDDVDVRIDDYGPYATMKLELLDILVDLCLFEAQHVTFFSTGFRTATQSDL
jgi:hypothetical protein